MTMDALISGLQNQNLRIPSEHYENVRRFTMTGQPESGKNRDDIPFDRYVDIWWLAYVLEYKKDIEQTSSRVGGIHLSVRVRFYHQTRGAFFNYN